MKDNTTVYLLDTHKLDGNISQLDPLGFPSGATREEYHRYVCPDVFRLIYLKLALKWLQQCGQDLISRVSGDNVGGFGVHLIHGYGQGI